LAQGLLGQSYYRVERVSVCDLRHLHDLAVWLNIHSLFSLLKLGLLRWIMGPFPLIMTNAAFIKFHRVFVALYSAGWLVKLEIAAIAARCLLS
jgi:hypothetical protein